jgi:hypothetical protein
MRAIGLTILFLAATGATCFAQQWEFGGVAGGGFLNTVGVTAPAGTATAGFQSGAAFGGFLGYNSNRHLGGEIRYGYLQSNLKLSGNGADATFSGVSHVVHYDVILHTSGRNSKMQLFAAFGGGMKIFKGTGTEAAYQPLSQFGYFTKTQSVKPMASIGAGVKWSIAKRVFLRTEFRDYITAFPKDIIAPAPGTKYGSILNDFVPMVGLSIEM